MPDGNYVYKTPMVARQEALGKKLRSSSFSCAALNPGPTLSYLTGLSFHLMERPVVAFFASGKVPSIVLPELEKAKLAALEYDIRPFFYGEDPGTWDGIFKDAIQAMGIHDALVAIEPRQLRVMELRILEAVALNAQFVPGEDCFSGLRMKKDASEIDWMRHAVKIAQDALMETLPYIKPGVSEREISSELTVQLLRHGSDSQVCLPPIVSSGPNSANPHALPTNREISEGDLLLIDWGASYHGYISDLTRTFAIGEVAPEFQEMAKLVMEANTASRTTARMGTQAGEVDRASRSVIEDAGYGQYFIHRTGHGIGMEGHEAPYIYTGNSLVLEPGMAFTIEPGIYLPDRGGVRIEDDVVITSDGAECLSDLPRELVKI